MAHGNIYGADKVDAALANYFRVGNLTALRELALLWLAGTWLALGTGIVVGSHRYVPLAQVWHGVRVSERTRDYEHEDDYSIPIGSRIHPERAVLWEPNSPISTTEEWTFRAPS